MIKPTVGRVMWFRYAGLNKEETQPCAAIVSHVNLNDTVNVAVFDVGGVHYNEVNVPVHQEGDEIPNFNYVEWMPYQIGQAKKESAT